MTATAYLIVHNHELGVDIDLEPPVLLGSLIGAVSWGFVRGDILPLLVLLFVTCSTSSEVYV